MTSQWRFRPLMLICMFVGLPVVRASVSPVSARLSRPNDNAVVKCVNLAPSSIISAWYRNSSDGQLRELSQKDSSKYRMSNDSLTVLKVGEQDVGQYICQVLDRNYTVDISTVPVVSRLDKSRNLVEGDRLELECSSWGWPTPNVTWRRRDPVTDVESDVTSTTVVSDASESAGTRLTLTIEHVALTDYSKYVCVAANSLGATNATILVRVKGWLAPLWPFIGICVEIIVLVVIIVIYETRRSRQLAAEARQEETQQQQQLYAMSTL